MTAFDDLSPDEHELATRLRDERPVPAPAVRRQVLHRLRTALSHRRLRRRSAVLLSSGWLLLALAAVAALTAPQ